MDEKKNHGEGGGVSEPLLSSNQKPEHTDVSRQSQNQANQTLQGISIPSIIVNSASDDLGSDQNSGIRNHSNQNNPSNEDNLSNGSSSGNDSKSEEKEDLIPDSHSNGEVNNKHLKDLSASGQALSNGSKMGKSYGMQEVEIKSGKKEIELQRMHSVGKAAIVAPASTEHTKVGVLELFRFADCTDYLLMLVGFVFACLQGTCVQINFVILGDVMDIFINETSGGNNTDSDGNIEGLLDAVPMILTQFWLNATGIMVFGFIQMTAWVATADRQIRVIRRTAFNNILRQHMGYFDKHKSGALVTSLTEDIATLQAGMGDKVATFVQWVSTFIIGAVICLVTGWELTLVILCVAPVAAGAGAAVAKILQRIAVTELEAYGMAGSVAEEVLSAIRIVAAYAGEKKEVGRYEVHLKKAQEVGIKKGMVSGLGQGMVWVIAFGIIGLAFWYGGVLVREDGYSAGFVLQVQFAMFVGMRSLGWSVGSLEAISAARGAAVGVFNIIDAASEIDSADQSGLKPAKCEGGITFEDVEFVYPTRTDVPVLTGLNLPIPKGKTVALVGPSGCGKSTTIQLLQRYYDPLKGGVKVDGVDVRDLNIHWLRNKIGVVSQEPILFATTLEENIRFGREDASFEEIKQASIEASSHDFIMKLPEGYQTVMSELGTQLSRGEKQRISLARALVRKPTILLLDEATSALDNEAEAVVQDALDKASRDRTTIVIAHRLSTVRNADILFVIDRGVVAEHGNHDELMAKGGLYSQLVSRQMGSQKDQDAAKKKKEKVAEIGTINHPVVVPEHLLHDVTKVRAFSINSIHDYEEALEDDDSEFETRSVKSFKSSLHSVLSKKRDLEASMPLLYDPPEIVPHVEKNEEFPPPAMSRIYKLNSPELPITIIGVIAAMLQGAIFPTLAVLFAEVLGAFGIEDIEDQKDEINFWVGVIAITGVFAGIFTFLMVYIFSYTGEKLTYRVRVLAFATMLRQEVGWFDDKMNQVGTLTSRLANDASRIKGATGSALCTIVNASSTAVFSLIIGFYFGWKLALVVSAFMPFLILVGVLQVQMMSGYAKGGQQAVEMGGKICAEAIDKVRTVAALTKEPYFEGKYNEHFDTLFRGYIKKAMKYGITWGLSQCMMFYAFGAAFGFGAYLVGIGDMEFEDVFRVFIAVCACGVEIGRVNAFAPDYSKAKVAAAKLVFIAVCAGGVEIGRVNAFAPDYSKAKVAAAKLFALFDRKSQIDPADESGAKPDRCNAHIKYRDIWFNYPTRTDLNILRGFNLEVNPGEFVAIVGASGNGKTTALQLLERFYDYQRGNLTLDDTTLKDLNIGWLRSQIGIVTQDPILFGVSIGDNIAYGDNSREVSMEEVIAAAKGANIHNFISTLPMGYETNVGSKGTQLSGGQKQRVSIARALVRNPKILILDDATSALDSESEKIVQEALKKAQSGRTSLVVAHRLSTIKDANQICYMEDGRIVERGKHQELMDLKGYYYKLQQAFLGHREEE